MDLATHALTALTARTPPAVKPGAGCAPARRPAVRVLVIPGLHDSGEAHWQTWLQAQYRGATRVVQRDWRAPDLGAWSQRITDTLSRHSAHTQWVAVAHSFGTLALAHHLNQCMAQAASGVGPRHGRIVASLMVAPADPAKFGVEANLPHQALGLPLTVIRSETDPWMPLARARDWAHTWGGRFVNLGDVGHINTDAGFGPWPLARQKVDHFIRQQLGAQPCLCSLADDRHFT